MRSRIADPRSDMSQDERDAPAAADGPRGAAPRLYDFELEPEVRDWLDSLSDIDFKRSRGCGCWPPGT